VYRLFARNYGGYSTENCEYLLDLKPNLKSF
jgi:hypothetical protein